MKKIRGLSLFLTILVLTALACTVFVGGPDYSSLPPIPVSAEAAASIQDEIRRAVEAAAQTGVITVNLTEPQITSYLAARLQTDPSLQQSDKKPLITDPQVYLRDGQMQIYGKTQQGMFRATSASLSAWAWMRTVSHRSMSFPPILGPSRHPKD